MWNSFSDNTATTITAGEDLQICEENQKSTDHMAAMFTFYRLLHSRIKL